MTRCAQTRQERAGTRKERVGMLKEREGMRGAAPDPAAPPVDAMGEFFLSLPIATVIVCGRGVAYANRAACALLGGPVGRVLEDLVQPADRERLAAALARCIEEGVGDAGLDVSLDIGSDPPPRVRLRLMPLQCDGQPSAGVLVRTMPEVRVAERALQESEDRYRRLVEHSPDAIYVHERGRILYANPAAARLLGLQSPAELVGRHVLDHVHPEDRAVVAERIETAIRTGQPITHVMTRLSTYDGRDDLWVEVAATPAFSDGRERFQVVCHDLTERLLAERALRESEERYRRLVESSPDAIGVLVRGVIVYANAAAAALLGVPSPQDLVGRHVLDHVHPECHDVVADRLRRAAEDRDIDPYAVDRIRSDDGRDLYVHLRAAPVRYGDEDAVQVTLHDVTGARQVEEDLRRTEQRLREVLDHARDMSYRMDISPPRFDYVSPASRALSGLSPEEVVSDDPEVILRRIHPDDRDGFVRASRMLVTGGYEGDHGPVVEYRWLHPDGTYRWYSDNRSLVRDEAGRPVAVVGSVRDITEQKEAGEALARSEERFRSVFEASHDLIFLYDRDLEVLYANRAALSWLGRPAEEVLGRPMSDALGQAPGLAASWEEKARGVLASGQAVVERGRHEVGGRTVYGETVHTPLQGSDGAPYAVATVYRDVTERHLAEAALRESEARARALFENIGDAFLLFDGDLCVVDANEAAAAMCGGECGALIGEDASRIGARFAIPGTDLVAALGEVLSGGGPRHYAGVEILQGDRATAAGYVDLVAYGVRVEGRQRAALLCRDVTASRRLEAALRQSEQLESLGRLAAGVAHDFGNLLSVVEGECELLQSMLERDDPALREVNAIQLVAESGASVIRQLVTFGRGEDIEPEVLHLNMLIQRNAPVLRRLLHPGIALTFDLCPEPLFYWGDAGQLTRVLVNLVMNAVDAISHEGHISVATRPTLLEGEEARTRGLAPGRYAVLTVSDDGEGIPEDDLPRLFEPHYTRRRGAARQGLGLSVVYGIVAQNRGTVQVESTAGAGASFAVYIPTLDLPSDEDQAGA